eukprot:403349537
MFYKQQKLNSQLVALRRLIFTYFAVICYEYPYIQLQALIFMSMLLMMYLKFIKPFESSLMNLMEFINEGCILTVAYNLTLFTDYQPDPDRQYQIGWVLITVTVFDMLLNILVMLYQAIKNFKTKLRQLIQKCKNLRKQKYGATLSYSSQNQTGGNQYSKSNNTQDDFLSIHDPYTLSDKQKLKPLDSQILTEDLSKTLQFLKKSDQFQGTYKPKNDTPTIYVEDLQDLDDGFNYHIDDHNISQFTQNENTFSNSSGFLNQDTSFQDTNSFQKHNALQIADRKSFKNKLRINPSIPISQIYNDLSETPSNFDTTEINKKCLGFQLKENKKRISDSSSNFVHQNSLYSSDQFSDSNSEQENSQSPSRVSSRQNLDQQQYGQVFDPNRTNSTNQEKDKYQ